MLCMMISLAASSSPQSGVLLSSLFVFAFHCYWASTNILLYAERPQTGLPLRCLSPALIHPSAVPLFYTGPPKLCSPPPACYLTLLCCGFPGLYAGCCLRQIEDPLCLSAPVPSGREEPAGLRVERQECAYEWASVCRAPADRGTACLYES